MSQQNITDDLNNVQLDNKLPLDVIFTNLDNISKINIGDKLIHDNKYITVDCSYVKSVTRWYYGFSRYTILDFIDKVLNEAYTYLHILKQSADDTSGILCIKLISRLKKSASGLTKLRQTYSYDDEFIKRIDAIIKRVLKKT